MLRCRLLLAFSLLILSQNDVLAQDQPSTGPIEATSAGAPAIPGQTKAKVQPAVVSGKVLEFGTDEPLADVDLVLINEKKRTQRYEGHTDTAGNFTIEGIEPGNYLFTASKEGMFAQSDKISFSVGQKAEHSFTLDYLESTDVMRVTGKRTLVHPEKIGSTTNLGRRFLEEYKSGNDLKDVITSTPGVVRDSFGNIITRGEHNAVNYELDGVVLPEAANTLSQANFASPRALQQVDVEIGGYEAKDGGGPLGAIVRMKSLPIQSKPTLTVGGQFGGPLAGNLNYYASTALSQNKSSAWNRVRLESVGSATATSMGIEAPVRGYARNGRLDLNFMNKIDFLATEKDRFRLTVSLNETFLGLPTSGTSKNFGVRLNQHDRSNYVIASYQRKGEKYFDEANLHFVNAFYSSLLKSSNAFDPLPNLVGEEPFIASTSARGRRFNYAFSAQGDIKKRVFETHNLQAGFLSEVRPVYTKYSALYYNANPFDPDVPYGALISPLTRAPGGPNFVGDVGRYRGLRYLQSAYFQDLWRPQKGILKRLTLDAGVRADVYHGVFGDTLPVAGLISTIPGVDPFLIDPFQKKKVTNAQVSGRFGGTFALTPNTALRGSFSQIFQPPPVDVFSTPPFTAEGAINGIFNGTVKPLQATRGHMVDCSVEQQLGPRFVTRQNFYYKRLKNFGDSGVVQNTPLYNRLSLSGVESYGTETRMELRPSRDGSGLHGFLSSTVQVALLRGSKSVTGGIYEIEDGPIDAKYPDHDRRYSMQAGLGYRSKRGFWTLGEISILTGLKDGRDPAIFGPHPARTPPLTLIGFNAGYNFQEDKKKSRLRPTAVDVRIENMLNQRLPINLGSPFQGTRYTLPVRVLTGVYWKV
jgi:hypothetical protein